MNNLDLIKQYVNTGQPIGDYQVSRLPKNLLGSYLRKRVQAANQSREYELTGKEFSLLTPELQWDLFLNVIKNNGVIKREQFEVISDEMKNKLLNYYSDTKEVLKPANDFIFNVASNESKIRYINMILENEQGLSSRQFYLLTPELKHYYAIQSAKKGFGMSVEEFEVLTLEERREYALKVANKPGVITDSLFELFSHDAKREFALARLSNGYFMTKKQFEFLTPKERREYALKKANNGMTIPEKQFDLLTPESYAEYKAALERRKNK